MDMYGFVSESVTEPRILPLPYTGVPFSISTLDGYFITSASQHPQESWKWISFLLQHQDASGNQVPPMNSQINSSKYADRVPADTLAIAKGLTPDTIFIGFNYSENDKFSQITVFFLEAVNQVILGESGAQRALDDAQGKALELFINQP